MKSRVKIVTTMLTVMALLIALTVPAFAKDYTYKIRVYAGKQGTFSEGKKVEIDGIKYGDNVTISLSDLGFKVTNSHYYARGLVKAGHDNDETTGAQSITLVNVTEDMSFVVAYGVKGKLVKYTAKYVDKSGKTLAPSDTYYGMKGDRPVLSYKYIEGYVPDAFNAFKTLTDNEKNNVFTFVYKKAEASAPSNGSSSSKSSKSSSKSARSAGSGSSKSLSSGKYSENVEEYKNLDEEGGSLTGKTSSGGSKRTLAYGGGLAVIIAAAAGAFIKMRV